MSNQPKQTEVKLVGKSFKIPEAWDKELIKLRGAEMASTGQSVSLAALILRALDQTYGLTKKTGVGAEPDDG